MNEEEIEKIIEMTINKSNKEYISLKKQFEELRNDYIELAQIEEKQEEVIEEAREYIESKNNGVCRVNGEEKPAYTFLLDFREAREFVWELLQILDKAKENK